MNGGSYSNSFFHRLDPGFVLQAGGFSYDPGGAFTYDSTGDTYPGGLSKTVEDDPVANEFSLSNLAGTIAMAKKSGQVNSATSQWFINLKNNSANLDGQNGGFTVFGKIMGNGLDIVTSIPGTASVNKSDIHPFFNQLPLIDYTSGQTVDETKLVKIISMRELVDISADIDFGYVYTSTSVQSDVDIQNRSDVDVVIGSIGSINPLGQPFTIVSGSDTCSNTSLTIGSSCSFTIDFTSSVEGDFADSVDIDFPVLGLNYTLAVAGKSSTIIAPEISPTMTAMKFGDVQFLPGTTFEQSVLYVHNVGNRPLEITSVMVTGRNATDYSYTDNCTTISPIAPGKFCVIPVNFVAASLGEKLATLTIVSNDSDEGVLKIPLSGVASEDSDGVPGSIEDGVNSKYDGNNDKIVDRVQNNVASIMSAGAGYMTVVSRELSLLKLVSLDEGLDTRPLPEDANLKFGVLSFSLEKVNALGSEQMGIILPENVQVDKVYAYGPTFDNTVPHWYEFDMRELTGAIIYGNVSIGSGDGTFIKRTFILLRLFDGIRGDSDGSQNGTIVFRGAVSVRENTAAGTLNFMALVAFSLLLLVGRHTYN